MNVRKNILTLSALCFLTVFYQARADVAADISAAQGMIDRMANAGRAIENKIRSNNVIGIQDLINSANSVLTTGKQKLTELVKVLSTATDAQKTALESMIQKVRSTITNLENSIDNGIEAYHQFG